jgi:hypothetical protein
VSGLSIVASALHVARGHVHLPPYAFSHCSYWI